MKKLVLALSTLMLATFSIQANGALTEQDLGEYQMYNPQTNKVSDLKFRFTSQGKYWTADIFQQDHWSAISCGEQNQPCQFTTSSRKTIERLFSSQPNLLKSIKTAKNVKTSCTDTQGFAFCRLDETTKKQRFYFIAVGDQKPNLLLLHKIN